MAIQVTSAPISAGAEEWLKLDCTRRLVGTEVLIGAPVITERTTTDLTITSKSVNVIVENILGESVAVGKAIVCFVVGAKEDIDYVLDVACRTSAGNLVTCEWLLSCV